MPESRSTTPPILADKHYAAPSAFTPESLLREARRQKGLASSAVPTICVLDPDGDLVRRLSKEGRAVRDPAWACYHTELHRFVEKGAEFSAIDDGLLASMGGGFDDLHVPVLQGATWTTDAPFRETAEAIAAMQAKGLLAVEMEAAALYAFAKARGRPVLCFAHVTNQMGRIEGDFEKGEADGTADALSVIVAAAWR